MGKLLKIAVIVLICLLIVGTAGFFIIKYLIPIPNIEIGSVDLKNVKDGSYTGEYHAGMVKAVVKVDVTSHKITEIAIVEHKNGLGKKGEKVTKEIEKAQSLNVDTISGATLSSKVIMKAVENALHQGEQ